MHRRLVTTLAALVTFTVVAIAPAAAVAGPFIANEQEEPVEVGGEIEFSLNLEFEAHAPFSCESIEVTGEVTSNYPEPAVISDISAGESGLCFLGSTPFTMDLNSAEILYDSASSSGEMPLDVTFYFPFGTCNSSGVLNIYGSALHTAWGELSTFYGNCYEELDAHVSISSFWYDEYAEHWTVIDG